MKPVAPWGWISFGLLLLLLPTPIGRLLLDLLGGFALLLILLPLLAGGAALIGWQLLRRRLRSCPSCGAPSLGVDACPVCGASMDGAATAADDGGADLDPRVATINVDAVSVSQGSGSDMDNQSS